MIPIVDPWGVKSYETVRVESKAPVMLTTTLYDLIAAIREAADSDDLVVATAVYMLHSGRVTFFDGRTRCS